MFSIYVNGTEVLDSAKLVKNGKAGHLNMRGDERLSSIVSDVRASISRNGWILPNNEKQIAEKAVELIHSRKYYGPYNEELGDAIGRVDNLIAKLKTIDDKSSAEYIKLESQVLEQHNISSVISRKVHSVENLKDFGVGELCCEQQSAIASYVLHQVGIPNELCGGVGTVNPFVTGSRNASGHSFVQSSVTGNIIEATSPQNGYLVNKNGNRFSDKEVVVCVTEFGGIKHYGGGKFNAITTVNQLQERYDSNIRKEFIDIFKEIPLKNLSEGVKVSQTIQFAGDAVYHADSGAGFLNSKGKPKDGELSYSETVKFLKSQGISLSKDDKEGLKILTKGGLDVDLVIAETREAFSKLDDNKNNKMEQKELQGLDQTMLGIIADAALQNSNNIPKAQVVLEGGQSR